MELLTQENFLPQLHAVGETDAKESVRFLGTTYQVE